jgi:hypothetical protein
LLSAKGGASMAAGWVIFLSMVFTLKLIWSEFKNWKRKYDTKIERLKRVNRSYARQIAGEEKR